MSQRVTETYTITAEAKYRRVYNGTIYTITWTDSAGEHKATSKNSDALLRFARAGFNKDSIRSWYRSSIKVVA